MLSDQLRTAIQNVDVTLYRVAKDAGVDWGTRAIAPYWAIWDNQAGAIQGVT